MNLALGLERTAAVSGDRPALLHGETVVADYATFHGRAAAPAAALDAHCLEQIARFKRPKAHFEPGELPKNNYGKVLKTELRRLLEEKT